MYAVSEIRPASRAALPPAPAMLFLVLSGCSGIISTPSDEPPQGGPNDPPSNVQTPVGEAPEGPEGNNTPIRRLTNEEYKRTLADLLDIEMPSMNLPPEEEVRGFKNNAAALSFSPVLAEQHLLIAEEISKRAVVNVAKLTGCGSEHDEACAENFITKLGQRAWRRPLAQAEKDALLVLFQEGAKTNFAEGARLIVQALLVSPHFEYRMEQGEVAGDGRMRPTSWEMASRLSYLLWGSMPDGELFQAARDNLLVSKEQVLAQAERLLKSPRAHVPTQEFFKQWLALEGVQSVTKETKAFAGFNTAVAEAQDKEIAAFLEDAFWSEAGNFKSLFTSRDTFVNKGLAKYYGLPEPSSDAFEKRSFADDQRAGILTMGGLMAKLAAPDQTSPTLRGVFVRERVLCFDLPPPPVSVDNVLPSPTGATTTRQRANDHQSDPACSACHVMFDPIGFGFERFDGAGRLRDAENGKPIDDSGEVIESGIGKFKGAADLGRKLAADEGAARCLATNVLRFALGRLETDHDNKAISSMKDMLLASDKPLSALLPTIVQSDQFLFRSPSKGVQQ